VPAAQRCLEAQVMDWSDDIAYSVHDLEDAIHAGHLRVRLLDDPDERAALVALTVARWPAAGADAVVDALARLRALPYWPTTYDGSHRALAALKTTTSQLIGRFCQAAEDATRQTYGDGPLARYAADLVVPESARLEVEVLKAIAARYVMDSAAATVRYVRQREVVVELVDLLLQRAPDGLLGLPRDTWATAPDDATRLRAVIDHVASLTDPSALAAHAALRGG